MRRILLAVLCASVLSSCSSTEPVDQDSQMEAQRFFGTVISVARTKDTDWQGVGNVATRAGRGTADTVSGGWFSMIFGPDTTTTSTDLGPVYGFVYVIEKEEGGRIQVHATDERLYHPGEEVMVVMNNAGFANVYPRDLEHAHPGGL